jgi:hypothetical protein
MIASIQLRSAFSHRGSERIYLQSKLNFLSIISKHLPHSPLGPFYIFAAFIFAYGTTVLHGTRNLLLAAVMVATMVTTPSPGTSRIASAASGCT